MHKLEYYKLKFSNLAAQGTDDWLNGRTLSFGGSEMATLLQKNKYEKWEELKDKKSGKVFKRSDSTEWGHWFEPLAKIYIEKEFSKIYEFGSIPHCQYPVCYSPDGVLVEDKDLVLLEIKNPIQRGIHKIPEMYFYQVLTGMCILNVKYTLFAQFRFRRCKFGTAPRSVTYDRVYHKEYRRRQKDAVPISFGYLYWKGGEKLVDLSIYSKMTDVLFEDASVGDWKPEIHIEEFDFKPETGYVLMWKLFEYSYAGIKPQKDFLSSKEEFLWSKFTELFLNKNKV